MSSYTTSDLANIKKAIASGVQQAMIAGEMVQYRTLSEMKQIKALIEADLSGSGKTLISVRAPITDRGI